MANRVIPPVGRFGGIGDLQKRLRGSQIIYDNRDDLARVMLQIASAKITDIVTWENGTTHRRIGVFELNFRRIDYFLSLKAPLSVSTRIKSPGFTNKGT